MNLVLKSPDLAPYEAGKDLSAMVLSEDSALARSACEILKRLGLNLAEEGRLIHQLWHPEFLIFNELRELAAVEAAAADIIMISVREGRELPEMIKRWVKRWLELRGDRPGALVAVLDSDLDEPDAARGILSQLKESAALGHLDFFATRTMQEGNRKVTRTGKDARQFADARKPRHKRIAGRKACGEYK